MSFRVGLHGDKQAMNALDFDSAGGSNAGGLSEGTWERAGRRWLQLMLRHRGAELRRCGSHDTCDTPDSCSQTCPIKIDSTPYTSAHRNANAAASTAAAAAAAAATAAARDLLAKLLLLAGGKGVGGRAADNAPPPPHTPAGDAGGAGAAPRGPPRKRRQVAEEDSEPEDSEPEDSVPEQPREQHMQGARGRPTPVACVPARHTACSGAPHCAAAASASAVLYLAAAAASAIAVLAMPAIMQTTPGSTAVAPSHLHTPAGGTGSATSGRPLNQWQLKLRRVNGGRWCAW